MGATKTMQALIAPLTSLPTWILSSAATRSHQALQAHLARAGVNGYAYRCLTSLAALGQLSQTELGNAASLDPRDVTHTVRDLEARRLVSRDSDPQHGRRVLVTLTSEGGEVAAGLASVMAQAQAQIFGRLSAQEQSTLLSLLARVG